MTEYKIVSSSSESTVVAEYESEDVRADSYQSEAELEKVLISNLETQGYELIKVKNERDLIVNLRKQLERLNDYTFSNNEWEKFFTETLASANQGIKEKTRILQEADTKQLLVRDDGTKKNITLLDKKDIHNNHLQVINQYEEEQGKRDTRYDVTILVNGFPLVHIELKRRGVAIREAFNQIERYQRDSFWASSGLYEYVQLFVISNGTHTKYYSNTTRKAHIDESQSNTRKNSKRKGNSFEFTSFWADGKNKIIPDLADFTKTFFAKHTILNILTKYCVFTTDELLLVMRPYQIFATEKILERIKIATNYKKEGSIGAGGYIWHTTGSGKTLTSFKTAQLVTALPYIDKVLFVVDRKDLDYQTMKEYDKFEKGAANGNISTKILTRQLENDNVKIIITTIQKLGKFIEQNKEHIIYNKHLVLIFDECHRSQFGEMHTKIIKAFKKYHIFGFTGTPIFSKNAVSGGNPFLKTTGQAFGENLHTYTIVDAITDKNVLPFRIDYINTIKKAKDGRDKKVRAIDTEKAMMDPIRIKNNVAYILEHFDQKTKRNFSYDFNALSNITKVATARDRRLIEEIKQKIRLTGFNSIIAVSSIPMAMLYYTEFKNQLKESGRKLNIATIYSFSVNEDVDGDFMDDESFDTEGLDQTSRDFLDAAIRDYNEMFTTNYDTSKDKFENYYKDLSLRVKNREVDLLIVVNMFLTGFDATTLNTLWVDKNLKHHGLIQAFSRTNRILNSVKTFGNIVCFRDLEDQINEALALFGDKEAKGMVLLKDYNSYYLGYDENGKHYHGYSELIAQLLNEYPLGKEIAGEQNQKNFIKLFGAILRLKNILNAFDCFSGNEILSQRDFQDYQSIYIDLYQEFSRLRDSDKERINEDIIFEIELIKQVDINIDYILLLVAKYHASNCEDKTILVAIDKAINSSIELRSKKQLIEDFIEKINVESNIEEDWEKFVIHEKESELNAIIKEENLQETETHKFIKNAFRDGALKTTGTDIDKIMPQISRFGKGNRTEKKQSIIEKLLSFFEKYFGLV